MRLFKKLDRTMVYMVSLTIAGTIAVTMLDYNHRRKKKSLMNNSSYVADSLKTKEQQIQLDIEKEVESLLAHTNQKAKEDIEMVRILRPGEELPEPTRADTSLLSWLYGGK